MTALPKSTCAHCGLPSRGFSDDAGRQFCCLGCQTVYGILQSEGLDNYYALRSKLGDGSPKPVKQQNRSYAEFAAIAADANGESRLLVPDLECAACVWLIERYLGRQAGVHSVDVSLAQKLLRVKWDQEQTSLQKIAQAVARLGYQPRIFSSDAALAARQREERNLWLRLGIAGAAAGNTMLLSVPLYFGARYGIESNLARTFVWLAWAVATPAVFYSGWLFHKRAWASLKTGTLHIDLPLSLGILLAYAGSAWAAIRGSHEVYFDSVTALVFLLLVGRLVLTRGHRRAEAAAETLVHSGNPTAQVYQRDGTRTIEKLVQELQVGDEILVPPNAALPADGVVVFGKSYIDCSVLTGEAKPQAVGPGSQVYAGCTNQNAPLRVRIQQAGAATRLAEIAKLLRQAASDRAPIVEMADKLAGWFTGATLLASAATFLLWLPHGIETSLTAAIAVAVVLCPCALGLATSLSLAVAQGRAAAQGIMFKGASGVQRLAEIDTLVLDKTGTLSQGNAAVVAWTGLVSVGAHDLRDLVASIEANSLHPLAKALSRYGKADLPTKAVQEVAGAGVVGHVAGQKLRIGSERWLNSTIPEGLRRAPQNYPLATPVWIEVNGAVAACAWIADQIHADSAKHIRELKSLGIQPILLSGDRTAIVAATAATCGIDRYMGQATPEQKLTLLRQVGSRVGMVGDGANDAAALAAAHVGVAVAGGVETALQAADVYLLRPGIGDVVSAIQLSRAAMRTIRRNLKISVAYNTIGMILAVSGQLGPLGAALLMPISSLTVILSSIWQGSIDTNAINSSVK